MFFFYVCISSKKGKNIGRLFSLKNLPFYAEGSLNYLKFMRRRLQENKNSFILITILAVCSFLYKVNLYSYDSINRNEVQLKNILDECALYCNQLSRSSLYFVCKEKVEELISPHSFGYLGGGLHLEGHVYRRIKREKNVYIYDYQLIKRNHQITEKRTLLKENGKKEHILNAPLKTKRFHYKHVVFGPTGLLSEKAQKKHNYKLKGEEKYKGKKALIIKCTPKSNADVKHLYGKVWIQKKNGNILKIRWEQKSLQNFKKVEKIGEKLKAEPKINLVSIYDYEKKGIRFPSRYLVEEKYRDRRNNTLMFFSSLKVTYKNYKFFTVKTEVKYE